MPSKQNNLSHSMDELLVRTISLIESLPERIEKLESIVREIEKSFSSHTGQQEEWMKGTESKISLIESIVVRLEKLENIPEINLNTVNDEIQNIHDKLIPLDEDLKNRNDTKKSIRGVGKELLSGLIRYAMLPVTIIILLTIGIDAQYIPWYQNQSQTQQTSEKFNRIYTHILRNKNRNTITERYVQENILSIPYDFILTSYMEQKEIAQREYEKNKNTYNFNQKEHIFIWLPHNQKYGYIQLIDKNQNIIANIDILREK